MIVRTALKIIMPMFMERFLIFVGIVFLMTSRFALDLIG